MDPKHTALYDRQSLQNLADATEYEGWLLEAAFSIVEDDLFPEWPDQMIYGPDGTTPTLMAYGRGHVIIGDWRPGFLQVAAPLIFVTAFKLLDMLVEWILGQNGRARTHRFDQKISALGDNPIFPPFIAQRPWLRDRLVILYERLDPLRGTIIHSRHFKTANGALDVASSRGNVVGPTISLAPEALRSLSILVVSVLKYVGESWRIDDFREMTLRRVLDDLSAIHGLPTFTQAPPLRLIVRAYLIQTDIVTIDIPRIRREIVTRLPNHEVFFDLRLVLIDPDGRSSVSYLLPWSEFRNVTSVTMRVLEDMGHDKTSVPADFDPLLVACDLIAHPHAQRVAR